MNKNNKLGYTKKFLGIILVVLVSAITISGAVFEATKGSVNANPETTVGGVIWGNITWSLNGSPYLFTDDVTVASNATLTIAPGAVVNIDIWALKVEGTLYAQGNETHRIVLQSDKNPIKAWLPRIYFNSSEPWDENTSTGCIIEYAEIDIVNSQYETILGGAPKISNNLIINYGNDAAAVRVDGIISNNTIIGGYRGIVAENGHISYNIIKDADVGISCSYTSYEPIYQPVIIGNLIIDNSVGIDDWSSSPYIANNTIVNNMYGIHFTQDAFSRDATPVGIVCNKIHNNNYDVFVDYEDPQITVNMTNNWWGTADTDVIAQKIWDQNDDNNLCSINYSPYLTSPTDVELPPDSSIPLAIFSVTPSTPHATSQITFDASASIEYSTITDYTWDFGDNNVTSFSNPIVTHTYAVSGSYNVTLTVSNGFATSSKSTEVVVLQEETVPVTVDNYDGLWHNADFNIALNATDQGSGVAQTHYQINEGTVMSVSIDGQPLIVTEGTNNILSYWSVDNNGNTETAHTITGIKLDKTAPFGSFTINENATYTDSENVTLTLSAQDTGSGIAQMRFSNDGATWSIWETYSANKQWELSTDDGMKTVFVQFKDNAELISENYHQRITIDTTKPTANAGSDRTVNIDTLITFSANQSTDNMGITSYSWDFGDGTTGSGETVDHGYPNKGNYNVTLTVQDVAGNTDTAQITVTVTTPIELPLELIAAALATTAVVAVWLIVKRIKTKTRFNTQQVL
ncbi:MAG: PKD domain-containing protein [Candidatus Bathyarchaeota archaeon]|nr:PKD domain-containing protein [Candidatus Bathyarchaeota archaeon]